MVKIGSALSGLQHRPESTGQVTESTGQVTESTGQVTPAFPKGASGIASSRFLRELAAGTRCCGPGQSLNSLAEEAELPGEAGQWLSDRKEGASWPQGEELVEGGGSPCEACGQRKRRLRASCSSFQDMLKDLRVLRGVAGTSLSDTCTDWWVGGGAAPLLQHDLHGRNRPALDIC